MLGLDIRFCISDDLPELLSLNSQCPNPWPEQLITREVTIKTIPGPSYIGAFSRGGDAGLLGYAVFGVEDGHALLMDIRVSPVHRRRGIGIQLIAAISECVVAMGFDRLKLRVRESNKVARSLYDMLGFEQVDVAWKYYSDGECALIMRAKLPLKI